MNQEKNPVQVRQVGNLKLITANHYHLIFNRLTGYTVRWGDKLEDDAIMAPSPELLDIELSAGRCSGACNFCYKSNSSRQDVRVMELSTFQGILEKLPLTVQQIAFGITDIFANPDIFKIFEACRKRDIVPNVTINGRGMKKEYYEKLAQLCGAVAVSHVGDGVICTQAVRELSLAGLSQKVKVRRKKQQ